MLNPLRRIKPSIAAGALWFAVLFALGFVLGTLRVLVTAPRLGDMPATLLELPVMLAAGWWLCRRLAARFAVPDTAAARGTMALVFLALLLCAEQLLGLTLFGRTPAQQLAASLAPAALLGLASQLLTVSFPLLQQRR